MRALRLLRKILYRTFLLGIALVLSILIALFCVGQWYTPGLVKTESLSPPPTLPTTTTPSALNLGTSPAASLVTELLAGAPSGYNAAPPTNLTPPDPILANCPNPDIPAATFNASESLVGPSGTYQLTISVYSAGLGLRALSLEQGTLGSCSGSYVVGTLPHSSGFIDATDYEGTQYQEAISSDGDVVLRVLAPPGTSNGDTALGTIEGAYYATLTSDLVSSGCVTPFESSTTYLRNPSSPGYTGLLISELITPPTNATAPNRSLLDAVPPHTAPPPLGSITTPPVAPVAPVYPATSAVIHVPQVDVTGPGCGWSFTGTAIPALPAFNLASATHAATQQLVSAWNEWPTEVTSYLEALSTYNADLSSYNLYVATSTTTTSTTTTTTLPPTTTTVDTTSTTSTTLPPSP